MARILIIDDEKLFVDLLSMIIQPLGHEIQFALTLKEGLERLSGQDFDLVLLDVSLPDGNGLEAIPLIKKIPESPEVIIVTSLGAFDGAELAIRSGAWDYIEKPSSVEKMILSIMRALQYRKEKQRDRIPKILRREGIIGESAPMKSCLELLAQAAGCQGNVLILGETGTGKELFARAIHNNNQRAEKNFVVVDCGALPENLIGSILFGYEKGAFTGAERSREGLIKQADGGTLFLDEVGELPLNDQKTFLRVLQERSFRPLGGKQEVKSDFRLVAATNRDLEEMVRLGRFREDLLFRLRTLTIEVPPLRERSDDIMELLFHFLKKLSKPAGKETRGFTPEFLETLLNYPWPGNVREMLGAIEAAIHKAGTESILFPVHLPPYIRIRMAQQGLQEKKGLKNPSEAIPASLTDLHTLRETLEKQYLEELLAQTSGNIKRACQISGVSRSRLYALLKKYQMLARLN